MEAAVVVSTNLSYVLFALLPPILWLMFYLREDGHPEPKKLLILVFVGGMASAILALVGECAWVALATGSCRGGLDANLSPLVLFGVIALIEEYVKYLPVKFLVLKKKDFDEPIDGMIYMMTAAMGFAALENILFLFPIFRSNALLGMEIATNRFLGANLLHALSSGLVGFFLARAFFHPRRHHFVALGIIIASILHTIFNYLILIRGIIPQGTFYLILLLSTMAVMVLIDFERLKKTREVVGPVDPV